MVAKDGRFYLRLSDDERQMFDEVAEQIGLAGNVSAAVRFLVREKHRALFGGTPAAKRPAKRPVKKK